MQLEEAFTAPFVASFPVNEYKVLGHQLDIVLELILPLGHVEGAHLDVLELVQLTAEGGGTQLILMEVAPGCTESESSCVKRNDALERVKNFVEGLTPLSPRFAWRGTSRCGPRCQSCR